MLSLKPPLCPLQGWFAAEVSKRTPDASQLLGEGPGSKLCFGHALGLEVVLELAAWSKLDEPLQCKALAGIGVIQSSSLDVLKVAWKSKT